MYDTCETVKVVSTDPDHQGPFVIINKVDFDADVHSLYGEEADEPNDDDAVKAEKASLVEQILARGGEKPHHATGVAKLQELLAALPPA